MHGLIVDNFAGGGGASSGIEAALGRSVDIAINHDPEAVAMHKANHPSTYHYCQSVWRADPRDVVQGRPVDLAWFSPDCKHFSKAKGGKPVEKHIRDLAWVVVHWAKLVRPRVIMLENVEEFRDWGPLVGTEDGKLIPCQARKGLTFRRWVRDLKKLGYAVEHRELRACDYGAPTIRKRLFVIARCDGRPIVWPSPTHGHGLLPFRTAAQCIDWSVPRPSIFERKRPLAEATMRRIARGVKRYVLDAPKPFIVRVDQTSAAARTGVHNVQDPLRTVDTAGGLAVVDPFLVSLTHHGGDRVYPVGKPINTVTGAHRGEMALVSPLLAGVGGRAGQSRPRTGDEPLHTITSKYDTALVAPTLVQMGYGEREGQAPRSLDIGAPMGTVVAGGGKHALVSAFLAKHYGGHETPGCAADEPISTVTAKDHHALVAATLSHQYGSGGGEGDPGKPIKTVTSGGQHAALVYAFLAKYYGTAVGQAADSALHSITSKDRFGVVTVMVDGHPYAITDIGMRMLTPRELFRAQGFRDDYIIDPEFYGKPLTKTAQIRMCGNSVCPDVAEALVRANFAEAARVAA